MKGFYAEQEALNEEALFSKSPTERCMARCIVSGWSELLQQWVNAEMRRADTQPTDVLHALASIQIQTFAAFLGPLVDGRGEGIEHGVELYVRMVRDIMPEHAELCDALRKAGPAERAALIADWEAKEAAR